jgi:hypothetical protein
MKALLIATALVALAAPALAGSRATGIGISSSSSVSVSRSNANSRANASTGNQTTIVGGNGNRGNNTPSVFAPSLGGIGADNCDSAVSFGASGPGGGLSFAFPKQNDPCNRRANARVLAQLGDRRAAKRALCFDPEMAQALGGRICRVSYVTR